MSKVDHQNKAYKCPHVCQMWARSGPTLCCCLVCVWFKLWTLCGCLPVHLRFLRSD